MFFSKERIDISAFLPKAGTDADAVSMYAEFARGSSDGRAVKKVSIESYVEMAESIIRRIVDSMPAQWPVHRVDFVHRIGTAKPGEALLVAAVRASGRTAAFEACTYLIEELHRAAPIWRKEHFADGTSQWIGGAAPEPGEEPRGRP
jgi:molybdopterin synthase catalytic subunit